MNFKFLTNNEEKYFIEYPVTEEQITNALNAGRQSYLAGHAVEDNPFITPVLYDAYIEGWDLEYSYDRLNQLNRQFYSQNNGL